MLDALKLMEHPREEQQAIELHRVLCLVATGKEADARGIIEGLVTKDPLYRPSSDLPPRVRSTYSETRKKMLPTAAQSAYQEAKAAFDFKDYSTAAARLRAGPAGAFRSGRRGGCQQVTAGGHPHACDWIPRIERQGCGSAAASRACPSAIACRSPAAIGATGTARPEGV